MPKPPALAPIAIPLALLLLAPAPSAQTAHYRLTVANTWSEASHPGAFPDGAHFSWLGGGTHDASVSFWDVGVLASPGIKDMGEWGGTGKLQQELVQAIAQGSAGSVLAWSWWFCPDGTTDAQCGPMVVEFDVAAAHPLVTLVTMLGPSPDWFVGVSGLPLHDGNGWLDEVTIDLHPYDGGTRDNNLFQLWGPLTTPPEPVSLITTGSGQLVGPGSLGSFTFTRIGQIIDVGFGLAGNFAPSLSGEGSLLPGEVVTLTTDGLPPASTAWMFLGTGELNQPLKGGVLVPDPMLIVSLPTGAGTLEVSGVMPPGVAPGAQILVQVWAHDAGGPAGACASNALELVAP